MSLNALHHDYPWTNPDLPLVVSAPMMKITLGRLAVATSAAGGIGFLAGGFDLSPLSADLAEAASLAKSADLPFHDGLLPIGVGFQNWGSDLSLAVSALKEHPVAAVWFFAPRQMADLLSWTKSIREVSNNKTKIWVQIGTVAEAREVATVLSPDIIVVQGSDAGGHGLAQRAGIITLLPEVADILASANNGDSSNGGPSIPLIAAGGIMDARGAAASVALGASGVALGTRFLASHEAIIARGYQTEILRVSDGGAATVNSKVYDNVRGIQGWPDAYTARGVINRSYTDAIAGMPDEENHARYQEEMKKGDAGWGCDGRMTTYAGTGVGLVREVKSVKEIVEEVGTGAVEILKRAAAGRSRS